MSWEVSSDGDTYWQYYLGLEKTARDKSATLEDRRNCLKAMRRWRDQCSSVRYPKEHAHAKRACEELTWELGGDNEPYAWRPVPEHLRKKVYK